MHATDDELGLECISEVMKRSQDDGNWVTGVRSMNVGGVANRGRPRKT